MKDIERIDKVWELIDRYRKVRRVAWFGTFKYAYKPGDECVVELWDSKEDLRASVCRSASRGEWYLAYYGDGYRGSPAYYDISEKEAMSLVEKIRLLVK